MSHRAVRSNTGRWFRYDGPCHWVNVYDCEPEDDGGKALAPLGSIAEESFVFVRDDSVHMFAGLISVDDLSSLKEAWDGRLS